MRFKSSELKQATNYVCLQLHYAVFTSLVIPYIENQIPLRYLVSKIPVPKITLYCKVKR